MADRLFVLLGAGASYDCASIALEHRGSMRPPLAKDIFAATYFNRIQGATYTNYDFIRIQKMYPAAQAAGAELRKNNAVDPDNAAPLEEYLRTKLLEGGPAAQIRYQQVPFYLQHLLWEVSQSYTHQADNYDLLASAVLDLGEVIFITLNYDTLLDDRLSAMYRPIDSLDAYVGEPWSLIKLHGSVNWAYPVDEATFNAGDRESDALGIAALKSLQDLNLHKVMEFIGSSGIQNMRWGLYPPDPHWLQLYYPALSVPLGSADKLNCRPDHVDHLKQRLKSNDGVHLLVIGYSGLDQEVLKLFKESKNHLLSLHVVDSEQGRGARAANRIGESFGGLPSETHISADGFSSFVQGADLDLFTQRVRSA